MSFTSWLPRCSRTFGALTGREIEELCRKSPPLIEPCFPREGFPSRGLGPVGYDLTLAEEFVVVEEDVLDPLAHEIAHRRFFSSEPVEVPPRSYLLARSVERIHMPNDLVGLVLAKSTYARLGLFCGATVLEPGWRGTVTLEIANLADRPVRIHPGRGIAQVLFFRTRPGPGYSGRYQDQREVTLPRARR